MSLVVFLDWSSLSRLSVDWSCCQFCRKRNSKQIFEFLCSLELKTIGLQESSLNHPATPLYIFPFHLSKIIDFNSCKYLSPRTFSTFFCSPYIHHCKNTLSSLHIFIHHCTFCASLHVRTCPA